MTWISAEPQRGPEIAPLGEMQSRIGTVERRRHARGHSPAEPSRTQLVSMIVGAYREMPGLSLHLDQATRLFGVRSHPCHLVLEQLVKHGTLRKSRDGQYRLRSVSDH